eukprot:m.47268 g.47268  ORF g.47268 m.47268 type:complete len:668 (-) comp10475_c0_seq1:37-2040(-)
MLHILMVAMSALNAIHAILFFYLVGFTGYVQPFLYKPEEGRIWDPSCIVHNGTYYCYFMYESPEDAASNNHSSHYGHGFLATSVDGVHFKDFGSINEEYVGVGWFKCMVHRATNTPDGSPVWVMNHGTSGTVNGPDPRNETLPDDRGCPAPWTQCLRVLTSSDLLHWEYNYTFHPDSQWYKAGRWDHMYMHKTDNNYSYWNNAPGNGFVGFPVATPLGTPAPGITSSSNGVNWTVHAPLEIEWGGVTPASFEIGGVEKMGNAYYMIGGTVAYGQTGYSMYVLKSLTNNITGPYAPDKEAFRMSGTSSTRGCCVQALATWIRNYDTLEFLISQYMVMPYRGGAHALNGGGDVWLLPLRKPVVDENGHLRLQFWEGNTALTGTSIPILNDSLVVVNGHGCNVTWVQTTTAINHTIGAILTATITVSNVTESAGGVLSSVGVALEDDVSYQPVNLNYDRPGNDYHCFGVNDSYKWQSCAAACEADDTCEAWTMVTKEGQTSESGRLYPCQNPHDKHTLVPPYCTLKHPVPLSLVPRPGLITGLPNRSLKDSTATVTLTSISDGITDNVKTVIGTHTESEDQVSILDTTGTFPCGDNVTCKDATLASLTPGKHSLRLLFRRGMFEVYADNLLVQTFTYGTYPMLTGKVGFAVNGSATVRFDNIQLSQMSLS